MPLRQASGQPLRSNISSQAVARSPLSGSAPRYRTSGSELFGTVPSSPKRWVSRANECAGSLMVDLLGSKAFLQHGGWRTREGHRIALVRVDVSQSSIKA